jgi:hypothetical protein
VNVNSFTPVRTRSHRAAGPIDINDGCRQKFLALELAAPATRIGKNPYQLSKIDGDIEKSSDSISEIVMRPPSDYSRARGREPTPPVLGIQHDRFCMEDFG